MTKGGEEPGQLTHAELVHAWKLVWDELEAEFLGWLKDNRDAIIEALENAEEEAKR